MNRDYHLKFCSKCKHRKMDFKKGLLCGLTDQFANFGQTCPDFQEEEVFESTVHGAHGVQIAITNERPKTYWHKLGWFVLIIAGLMVIKSILVILGAEFKWENNIAFYVSAILAPLTLWTFLGWELNKLVHGIVAGVIQLAAGILTGLLELDLSFSPWTFLPFLAGAIYFGFMAINDNSKRLRFVPFALILAIATTSLSFFMVLELQDPFYNILEELSIVDRDIRGGFINYSLEGGEYMSSIRLDGIIIAGLSDIILFMGIALVYKYLSGEIRWELKKVCLGRNFDPGQMALLVVIFYSSIVLLSFGIFGIVMAYFKWIKSYYFMLDKEFGPGYDIYFLLLLICAIPVWYTLVLTYRKILITYYLDHLKPISWNFYFGQIPVIGVFIWIYNLTSFKLPKKLDIERVREVYNEKNGVATFVVIMSILALIGSLSLIQFSPVLVVPAIVGFGLVMLYLYNPAGIYVYMALYLISFLVLIILMLLKVEISEAIISRSIFLSMAQLLVAYPVFHLNTFKIDVPVDKTNEDSSLILD